MQLKWFAPEIRSKLLIEKGQENDVSIIQDVFFVQKVEVFCKFVCLNILFLLNY